MKLKLVKDQAASTPELETARIACLSIKIKKISVSAASGSAEMRMIHEHGEICAGRGL
jgi:hypothetical protein